MALRSTLPTKSDLILFTCETSRCNTGSNLVGICSCVSRLESIGFEISEVSHLVDTCENSDSEPP